MSDPTAQQLAYTVLELFDRCPELRPEGLTFDKEYSRWRLRCVRQNVVEWIADHTATQLCESQMVRWLVGKRSQPEFRGDEEDGYLIEIITKDGGSPTSLYVEEFVAPTLVQALAAACTAVLDAK